MQTKKTTNKKAAVKKTATVKKVKPTNTVTESVIQEPTTNDVLMWMMQFLGKMNDTQEKILQRLSSTVSDIPAEPVPHEQTSSSEVQFEVYGEFYPKGDHMMIIKPFGRYRSREWAEKMLEEVTTQWQWVPYQQNGESYFFKTFWIKDIVIRTFETKNLD